MKLKCNYCDDEAKLETMTNNVYLCEKPGCHSDYVMDECAYSEEGFEEE